jgi:hypothetical protein
MMLINDEVTQFILHKRRRDAMLQYLINDEVVTIMTHHQINDDAECYSAIPPAADGVIFLPSHASTSKTTNERYQRLKSLQTLLFGGIWFATIIYLFFAR